MAKDIEDNLMKAQILREKAKRFIEKGTKFPEGSKERTNYHGAARNNILVAMDYELNYVVGVRI